MPGSALLVRMANSPRFLARPRSIEQRARNDGQIGNL